MAAALQRHEPAGVVGGRAWRPQRLGRVVDAYRCTTIDEDRIYHEVQAAGEAIVARTGLPVKSRWPVV
jgi:hypothetical protein